MSQIPQIPRKAWWPEVADEVTMLKLMLLQWKRPNLYRMIVETPADSIRLRSASASGETLKTIRKDYSAVSQRGADGILTVTKMLAIDVEGRKELTAWLAAL